MTDQTPLPATPKKPKAFSYRKLTQLLAQACIVMAENHGDAKFNAPLVAMKVMIEDKQALGLYLESYLNNSNAQ